VKTIPKPAASRRGVMVRWLLAIVLVLTLLIFGYIGCRVFITLQYERLIAAQPHSLGEVRAHLKGLSEREIRSAGGLPLAAVVTSGERYLRFTWLFFFSIDVVVDSRDAVVGIHADFE